MTAGSCSRREFLALTAAGALTARPRGQPTAQDTLAGVGPAGRLYDPERAGRPRAPITARDTDPAIQAIEKRLKCTCGCNLDVYTCRTTDFTCTVSPELHRQVIALADAGLTEQEIVDEFVARHGVAILMAPPKRGFNLAAYFLPATLILAAGVVLTVVLRRWVRSAEARVPASSPPPVEATAAELEQLRRELDRLPT